MHAVVCLGPRDPGPLQPCRWPARRCPSFHAQAKTTTERHVVTSSLAFTSIFADTLDFASHCVKLLHCSRHHKSVTLRPKQCFGPFSSDKLVDSPFRITWRFHARGGVSVLVQKVQGGGRILRPLAPGEKISHGGNIL